MSAITTALFLNNPEVDPVFQKVSMESQRSASSSENQKHTGTFHKLGHKIVKAAKEHHKSVNSAFTAYYGLPAVQRKAGVL